MAKVTRESIESILQSDGFPLEDYFSKFLYPLIEAHHPDVRDRVFPPEVTIIGLIHQAINNGSLRDTLAYLNASRLQKGMEPVSINTAGFSKARGRLSAEVISGLATLLASKTSQAVSSSWLWHGMQVKAIDGTTVTLDDTEANQEMFPQSPSQKKGVGFPIVMMVVFQSLVTGMIEAMNFGPVRGKESGEMALARSIMGTFKSGDLLLGDRYYPSYFLISMLLDEGINGVFQSHGARKVDFRTGVSLGVKDHLSTWIKPKRPAYMSEEAYSEFPDSITVRELDVTHEFDSKDRVILTTTLLDSEKYSKQALAELYRERWKIEVALRDIKITMGWTI